MFASWSVRGYASRAMGKRLDLALGILNGTVGDHLARAGNGLAIPMALIADGRRLAIDRSALLRAHPNASPRLVLLVHGLMSNESVWTFPDGSDYGSLLTRDLGFTPLYLRYNTGLAI